MAWRNITDAIGSRLMEGEREALNAAGGYDKLVDRANDAAASFVGAMSAAGYAVPILAAGAVPLVPDQLRNYVMAIAREELLQDFPEMKKFQTEERKSAAAKAYQVLNDISQRKYGAIEIPPAPNSLETMTLTKYGSWNSQNRLIMRCEPIPTPADQIQIPASPVVPPYANPDAAPDTVPTD